MNYDTKRTTKVHMMYPKNFYNEKNNLDVTKLIFNVVKPFMCTII